MPHEKIVIAPSQLVTILTKKSEGPDAGHGLSWLVERIRKRQPIERKAEKPLFDSIDDKLPLFIQAALLDALHDIWRLNSEKMIYRLGVIMGHKLRVELGEKMQLEEPKGWEDCVGQVCKMLELFSHKVSLGKVTRLYALFETEGCPCKRMSFAIGYCPQDALISGMMAGFAQQAMNDDRIYCTRGVCGRAAEKGLCVHELRVKEEQA